MSLLLRKCVPWDTRDSVAGCCHSELTSTARPKINQDKGTAMKQLESAITLPVIMPRNYSRMHPLLPTRLGGRRDFFYPRR
ncbi:hypothetical protein FHX77_000971 [Bifidobacterium commune]|nr:hypothetical protein [Bifidobacterium commune]